MTDHMAEIIRLSEESDLYTKDQFLSFDRETGEHTFDRFAYEAHLRELADQALAHAKQADRSMLKNSNKIAKLRARLREYQELYAIQLATNDALRAQLREHGIGND